jgi:anti-sigma regulatory factor (Ser/Thr protein kinase)
VIGHGPQSIGPADAALRLQSDPAELSRARKFAHAAATRFGMSRTDREDFMLAASEAVANAIEHGCPCCDGVIHVWAAEQDESLTLGVRNGGEFGFETGSADAFAERGRGLPLMARLVDTVALRRLNGHTQLELTKGRDHGDR